MTKSPIDKFPVIRDSVPTSGPSEFLPKSLTTAHHARVLGTPSQGAAPGAPKDGQGGQAQPPKEK